MTMKRSRWIVGIPTILLAGLIGCREPNQAIVGEPVPAAAAGGEAPVPSVTAVSTRCNLESADGSVFDGQDMRVGRVVKLAGWLDLGEAGIPGSGEVVLSAGDKEIAAMFPVAPSMERPDVSSATGAGASAGFEVTLELDGISAGRYHVYLRHRSEDELMVCDNGRHLLISN